MKVAKLTYDATSICSAADFASAAIVFVCLELYRDGGKEVFTLSRFHLKI